MNTSAPSAPLLFTDTPESPADLANTLARPAAAGHFDELRGPHGSATRGDLTPQWSEFFTQLGTEGFTDLDRRTAGLRQQVRDNDITYNAYADSHSPQRPWSLELLPLLLSQENWRHIETGVLQRVRLLERIMADVYGPQELLRRGLLPPALVQGHPGYLRALHGVNPTGAMHLHIVAFDLARGPDGHWWLIGQRTQAPSGLGYLLENRLVISRQFPKAFEAMQVQRVAASYRALMEGLKTMSPCGADAHIALLTPGPRSETYFEHAYLARYLGLTLVEGGDLTVREQRLYLKTLRGLEPVHGLLKRLDDPYLDPLELRADSALGVPGLLQAMRAGHVLVANAPGAGFLESPALLGFLPALARHLLDEALLLPALPTWWCGERAALEAALPQLSGSVIKSTYPGANAFLPELGPALPRRALDEWAGRIMRESEAHTLQVYLPLAQMPTWQDQQLTPRSFMLRVFALCDGPQSWQVLPGGLALTAATGRDLTTLQRGGSSADAWVQAPGAVDHTTLLQPALMPASPVHRRRVVTSRSAENLFWLGRYSERAENTVRLTRLTLERLGGEDGCSPALLNWLNTLAVEHSLVLPDVPSAAQARRVFERSLIASLGAPETASVGSSLRALKQAASAVRERLAPEHWSLIVRAEHDFFQRLAETTGQGDYASAQVLRALESVSLRLAAMTGAQTDRMTRDDGWRLLSIGRHLERLGFLAGTLAHSLDSGAVHEAGGFAALLALFDSTISFRAQYQQRRDLAALLDLLVHDGDNPHSLGWVAQTLRGRLRRLAQHSPGSAASALTALADGLPEPEQWPLAELCERGPKGRHDSLLERLHQCAREAWQLSDDVSVLCFAHAGEARYSVGA